MTEAPPDDGRFTDWHFACREGMEKRSVPDQLARVLDVLLLLSFAADEPKTEARVYRLELLAHAAKMNPGNLSKVLDAGVKARVFRKRDEPVRRSIGKVTVTCVETIFEIMPAWQNWQLPDRYTDEVLARADHALAALRDGRDPDQGILFQRDTDLDDGFVAASRDAVSETSSHGGSHSYPVRPGQREADTGSAYAVQPLVRGTSGAPEQGVTEETGGVVPGTSGSPLSFKVPTMEPLNLKGSRTPNDHGELDDGERFESAAVQPREDAASPGTRELDYALVQRMERAIGADQVLRYGDLWRKRLFAVERPMRVTVDAFWERDRRLKPIKTPWQWILDGYVSRAVEMGQSDQLLECDKKFLRKKLASSLPRWKALAGKLVAAGRKVAACFL